GTEQRRTRHRDAIPTNAKDNGTPSTTAMTGADSDARRDRRSAVIASDDVSNCQADAQGVRTSRPASGNTKNAAPTAANWMNRGGAAVPPRLRREEAIMRQRPLPIRMDVPD